MDAVDNRREITLFGFAFGGAKRVGEEVEDLEFSLKTSRRRVACSSSCWVCSMASSMPALS